jgi:hypothetical protein
MPHVSDTQDSYLLNELAGQLEKARRWSPHVVDTLVALVAAGEDSELFRINPIRYARQTGITPGEAIDRCVVKLGMFEMDWQAMPVGA